MNRSTAIAGVIAAGGILVAGSVAGIAIVNAASSADDSTAAEVVASDQQLVPSASAQPLLPDTALPSAPSASALPDLGATQPTASVEQAGTKPSKQAASKPSSPKPAAPKPEAPGIAAPVAKAAVADAAKGQVLDVSKVSHQGQQSWAVQVARTDGSVVTGYVDIASGVVFDWKVDQQAPAPTQAVTQAGSGDDGHGSDSTDRNHDNNAGHHEGEGDDD